MPDHVPDHVIDNMPNHVPDHVPCVLPGDPLSHSALELRGADVEEIHDSKRCVDTPAQSGQERGTRTHKKHTHIYVHADTHTQTYTYTCV